MNYRMLMAASAIAIGAQSALAVDAFTSLPAWEAAAGTAIIDDFTSYGIVDLALGDNNFFNGYTITLAGTGTGGTNINGANNLVFTLGAELESMTFTFDSTITGIGADWLNSFVSNGLTVTVNGEAFNVEDFVPQANFEFLGFTDSGNPLSGATVMVTNPGQATEFAAISNLYYAVPTPATAAVFGFAGLAATRRRR